MVRPDRPLMFDFKRAAPHGAARVTINGGAARAAGRFQSMPSSRPTTNISTSSLLRALPFRAPLNFANFDSVPEIIHRSHTWWKRRRLANSCGIAWGGLRVRDLGCNVDERPHRQQRKDDCEAKKDHVGMRLQQRTSRTLNEWHGNVKGGVSRRDGRSPRGSLACHPLR